MKKKTNIRFYIRYEVEILKTKKKINKTNEKKYHADIVNLTTDFQKINLHILKFYTFSYSVI